MMGLFAAFFSLLETILEKIPQVTISISNQSPVSSPPNSFLNQDWSTFGVETTAALISSAVTIAVFIMTIRNEFRKIKIDEVKNRKQLLEDKRLSVQPYLCYDIIENKLGKSFKYIFLLVAKEKRKSPPNYDIKDLIYCRMSIYNGGIGIALEIKLKTVRYDEQDFRPLQIPYRICVSEIISIEFEMILPSRDTTLYLTVEYRDIYRNLYVQNLSISYMTIQFSGTTLKPFFALTHVSAPILVPNPPDVTSG